MNVIPAFLSALRRNRYSGRNVRLLFQVLGLLTAVTVLYSILFYYLMLAEGQHYSITASVYWVLTTMTTLGYGDIIFTSGTGQIFSVIVLGTGILLIFIILPFTFIETIYASWVEANKELRAPSKLPWSFRGHVIITSVDPVSFALIRRLERYKYTYVLLVPSYEKALPLADQGFNVMVGELDNPLTYEKAHIEIASMVAATCEDPTVNSNVSMTVKRLAPGVPLVALSRSQVSSDILTLAGADHTLNLPDRLGNTMARLAHGAGQRAHSIAEFDSLVIAEATARDTNLVGLPIEQTTLRSELGVNVVGLWLRGSFIPAEPGLEISPRSVLVLAGTTEQIQAFNTRYRTSDISDHPVVIIGGGRVGQATALALSQLGVAHRIIERDPEPGCPESCTVIGDASRQEVLAEAGIEHAPTAIITTHSDDVNIYLTLYLRSIRPDMVIVSRSMQERNLANLHKAGADFVMSHSSMGANAIFNMLKRGNIEMLAEGLDIFRIPIPPGLAGRKLADVNLRKRTGCIVIAIQATDGLEINPDPQEPLPVSGDIVILATVENEARFLKQFPPH